MEDKFSDKNNDKEYSISSSSRSKQKTKEVKSYTIVVPSISLSKILKNPKFRFFYIIILIIILSLSSGLLGGYIESKNNNFGSVGMSLSNQKKIVTSQSQLITQIAKQVSPSVVSINVTINTGSGSNTTGSGLDLFGFTQSGGGQEQAAGTGIIISSNGLIVTNRHVVPVGTTNVTVTLNNGVLLKNVSVIGRTSQSSSLDIAFLKINNLQGQKLTPAVIGNSSDVQIGDSVVAIGNALGQFQNTITSGIISGFGRNVTASSSTGSGGLNPFSSSSASSSENLTDLFQTDAAINEGNSGGPLVNMNGQVIGINTAIAGNAQNIGFSIPINDVTGLINQVLKTGKFAVPYLGVMYIPINSTIASEYNLSVINGAFIAPSNNPSQSSVISGSPADKAGLQVNDIITAVNGVNINQTNSLTGLLDQYKPGDSVNLSVIRGNKVININVTLGAEPAN